MHHEKKDIKVQHDFADRLVAEFATEIQPEYFGGNQTLPMEGLAMECTEASNIFDGHKIVKGEFHSFLSDDSDKGAATIAAHTEKI
eukprot:7788217-Ditylum_brightwellii.AAC.1